MVPATVSFMPFNTSRKASRCDKLIILASSTRSLFGIKFLPTHKVTTTTSTHLDMNEDATDETCLLHNQRAQSTISSPDFYGTGADRLNLRSGAWTPSKSLSLRLKILYVKVIMTLLIILRKVTRLVINDLRIGSRMTANAITIICPSLSEKALSGTRINTPLANAFEEQGAPAKTMLVTESPNNNTLPLKNSRSLAMRLGPRTQNPRQKIIKHTRLPVIESKMTNPRRRGLALTVHPLKTTHSESRKTTSFVQNSAISFTTNSKVTGALNLQLHKPSRPSATSPLYTLHQGPWKNKKGKEREPPSTISSTISKTKPSSNAVSSLINLQFPTLSEPLQELSANERLIRQQSLPPLRTSALSQAQLLEDEMLFQIIKQAVPLHTKAEIQRLF